MPNSNESSESEFSNENQQNIINRNINNNSNNSNHSGNNSNNSTNINLLRNNNNNKPVNRDTTINVRHQNYSKNIYIGTRNAEKWDNLRTNLSFKNDVEFVSYLLSLAEKEQQQNGLSVKPDKSPTNFIKHPSELSQPLLQPSSGKKSKKVQFHEEANEVQLQQLSPENQLHHIQQHSTTKRSTSSSSSSSSSNRSKAKLYDDNLIIRIKNNNSNNIKVINKTSSSSSNNNNNNNNNNSCNGIGNDTIKLMVHSTTDHSDDEEVLDCRIEEKIKSEILEQKHKNDNINLLINKDVFHETSSNLVIDEKYDDNDDIDDNDDLNDLDDTHSEHDNNHLIRQNSSVNDMMDNNNDADDEDNDNDDDKILCLAMKNLKENFNTPTLNLPQHPNFEQKINKKRKKKLSVKLSGPKLKKFIDKNIKLNTNNNNNNGKKLGHDIRKAPIDGARISNIDNEPDTVALQSDDNRYLFHNENAIDQNHIKEHAEHDEYEFKSCDDEANLDLENGKIHLIKNYNGRICRDCNMKHNKDECQIRNPLGAVKDSIELNDWMEKNKDVLENEEKLQNSVINSINSSGILNNNSQIKAEELDDDDDGDDDGDDGIEDDSIETSSNISNSDFNQIQNTNINNINSNNNNINIIIPNNSMEKDMKLVSKIPSYSEASLPEQFDLRLITDDYGIFTKIVLPKFTQLGPIIGEPIQEIDISDDCNMKFIIETYDGVKSHFLSLENKNKSNWLRYIRPASSRELRNTTIIVKDKFIYFVTCTDIEVGCELLYWSDENNSAWDKKKIDRINCGGCNLKFDHPLFYRTHCSVFHDPAFSLTIRKYHCKVCGIAVLGKENIMKHAAQMHEGKGAYQCQYCKKFFLRLNYLEMHRTYGCSANPQRARPLCDFCGRKFCQPQKLKVHIKRMHSDMAEVLRDFQCKLCSKLLGSRAALQRHSKEVHSRNSTVVSCPRCQKLFQNRSNLKIHMLTHSGVRPFRCAENECSAAFTTKQCLQFHYKKVHGYTQEQMPKIERSVAYTFDAYSGGMKIDVNAEQKSRRRRRSIDYENSLLNHETDDNDDNSYSTQNTKDNNATNEILKQHHASISEICKNETNLSLLSNTISSFLSQEINRNQLRDGDSDQSEDEQNGDSLHSNSQMDKETERNPNFDIIKSNDDQQHHLSPPPNHQPQSLPHPHLLSHHHQSQIETTAQQQNAQLSLVESFLSETSSRLHLETNDDLSMISSSSNNNIDSAKTPDYRIPETINKVQEYSSSNNSHQNLVVSKGSKKWINTDISETNDMSVNRDFLSKLIMSSSQHDDNDDDDNSTILDVVETNQNNQYHSPSLMGTPESLHQLQHHMTTPPHPIQHQHHLHHLNHQSNLVSGFYNNNRQIGSISTSASMLVEAALNSVSNIIDSEPDSCQLKSNSTNNHNDDDNLSSMNVDIDATTGSNTNNNNDHMNHVDFSNDRTSYHHQNTFIQSPIGNGMVMKDNNNDIDVDSVSTPNESFQNHATPSPRAISPGQDYPIMYSTNHHNMSNCRRGSYTSLLQDNHLGNQGHQSPQSLPRYDFNNLGRRKRDDQLSSDDENSIIVAQNLSVNSHHNDEKMKLPHSQIEILYSKYSNDNLQGGLGHDDSINDINETRLKYNNGGNSNNNSGNNSNNNHNTDQGMDIAEFRSNSSNETISDFQGVDMSSRSILGGYHHSSASTNFQIPPSGVNLSLNRYHHHIYDILQQDREPTSQNEQHNQMSSIQQQQQQNMHNLMQDQINEDQNDQSATVDLSRSANYVVSSPPPPPLPYSHSHSEMLRMVSLDLTPSGGSSTMLVGGNSHLRHSSSILSSHQINHNSRDSLSVVEHNRLISSEQISSNHRLLVDPTAHLLMEQNNRIISENRILDQTSRLLVDPSANRHMVSSRGFGAYHHQVPPTNYHHTTRSGLASPHSTNPSNYHPFSAYY